MNKRLLHSLKRIACVAVVGFLASTCAIEIKADDLLKSNYDLGGMLNIYKETKDTLVLNGVEVKRDYITRNYNSHRKDIEYIVVHDTDNRDKGANAEMHTRYYQTNSRGASAHYTVDDGIIINNVREEHSAYHCGDGHGKNGITNSNSIGIEMCVNSDGDYDKTFENTQALVRHLMDKYNVPFDKVVMHRDASGKGCSRKMIEENLWKTFKDGLREDYDLNSDVDVASDKETFALNENVDFLEEASWTSNVLTKLEQGTYVKLLGQDSQWSKVELISDTDDNKIGFVPNTSLEGKEAIGKAELKIPTYLRANKSWSSAPYDIIVNANEELNVYETDEEWTLVAVNGTYGYISTDMLKMK